MQKSMAIAIAFGLLTPIGIVVGLCIESHINQLASNVLICIASGALLYAAICEVMIHEFSEERQRERKMFRDYGTNATENGGGGDEKTRKVICTRARKEDFQDALKLGCVFLGFGFMWMLALWV